MTKRQEFDSVHEIVETLRFQVIELQNKFKSLSENFRKVDKSEKD